ncbi:hypothetical protein V8C86DRAFT_2505849 [Haematococcus lacustris]
MPYFCLLTQAPSLLPFFTLLCMDKILLGALHNQGILLYTNLGYQPSPHHHRLLRSAPKYTHRIALLTCCVDGHAAVTDLNAFVIGTCCYRALGRYVVVLRWDAMWLFCVVLRLWWAAACFGACGRWDTLLGDK